MSDDLGDRMKAYEAAETGRVFMPFLPVLARIDGRCFSSFTQGMERPYDQRMQDCMVATATELVEETGALAGYTQSDEITLLWYSEDPKTQMLFGGKVFKLTSICAALATSIFSKHAAPLWPQKFKKPVTFDARVWQVPNQAEAANTFLWRELDATKNAVSMAARHYFSHSALQGKSGAQMQEMLFQEKAVNFNDYPARFKRGTFVLRRKVLKELPQETLARIPEQHRPTGPIERQEIAAVDMPRFGSVLNRVGVLFNDEQPAAGQTP